MDLSRNVALITGASRGIGMEIAKKFASLNCDIIINYKEQDEKAKELKKYIENTYNVKVLNIKANLENEQEIINMVEKAIDYFGKIDILVNNAAICNDCMFLDKTKESFTQILNVNLIAPFLLSKYVSKYMKENKYGRIINIASTNGIDTYYSESMDYDASKAALINLTHNLALELAPYITVNAIAPGWTNTDMNKELTSEQINEENKKIILNRFAEPQEIANVVAFLASKEASYINSEVIRVDGGKK